MMPFDGPVYAVGDVHGCLALYREIESKIKRDAAAFPAAPTIVLLGDMIDRGPQSAGLIDHLLAPAPGMPRWICLTGNHEAMMLDYLANPKANGDWLTTGGFETLISYGIMLDPGTHHRMTERKLRQMLAAHLPESHLRFLRGLHPALKVGPYLLAHAGADATAPLTAQPRQALVWGTAGRGAPGNLTLIHGHYVTATPDFRPRSIGVDTGAYATGRLTALRLAPGRSPAFLTTAGGAVFADLCRDD